MSIALTPAASTTTVSVSTTRAAAVTRGERLEVLDVLRGIALLGMYVIHFGYYVKVDDVSKGQAPPMWERLQTWFLEGRFYTMFAMLFGIGFAVQLARADARGENIVPRYLRRIAALAVFGFIAHGVLGYSILLVYAIWGLALLPIRRWSTGAIVALFLVSSMFYPLFFVSRVAIAETRGRVAEFVEGQRRAREDLHRAAVAERAAEKSGEWSTVVAGRIRWLPHFYGQYGWDPGGAFMLMLAGLLVFRSGVFEDPAQKRRVILWAMLAGATSFVLATWVFPLPGAPSMKPDPLATSAHPTRLAAFTMLTNNAFLLPRQEWLAVVYIGIVLLLVAHDGAWLRRLAPFSWNGRMALTNYMVQIILLDVTFSPYALGLKGTMAPRWIPVCAIALFAVQAVCARWWLARYEYGPFEWVWRSVTYWRPARFRRTEMTGAPAPAAVSASA